MYEEVIVKVTHYLEKIEFYASPFWVFRGHADIDWKLVPAAGRPEYYNDEREEKRQADMYLQIDLIRFQSWKKSAVAYGKNIPTNDFEALAVAQHFGLATRLMDWSTNPLIALFFAVESCTESDGCVYVFAPTYVLDSQIESLETLNIVCNYDPPPLDNRILAQQGVFTYHPHANEELIPGGLPSNIGKANPFPHESDLVRFKIPADCKRSIKRQLNRIGINRKYLFADLDGLSAYANWETEELVNWKLS